MYVKYIYLRKTNGKQHLNSIVTIYSGGVDLGLILSDIISDVSRVAGESLKKKWSKLF